MRVEIITSSLGADAKLKARKGRATFSCSINSPPVCLTLEFENEAVDVACLVLFVEQGQAPLRKNRQKIA